MASQQDSTHCNGKEGIPLPEGLTPQQEQAASLLAAGMANQDVAERLDVHRSTLWHWRQLETFKAYLNGLRKEAAHDTVERLVALQENALDTISRIMENGSDASALKAACYVLEQAAEASIGPTDPRAIIRAAFASDDVSQMVEAMNYTFDEQEYRKRCEELGIQP